MKNIFALVIAGLLAFPAGAADTAEGPPTLPLVQGSDVDLSEFLWTKRPIVVFADTPNDPRFIEQMNFLNADIPALLLRDIVVLTDTDPAARSDLRRKLRPRGFMLVLIDKDGGDPVRVTTAPGFDGVAQFSPDGIVRSALGTTVISRSGWLLLKSSIRSSVAS